MAKYKLLKCRKFGKILLESGDLDPIYIMLYDAKLDEKTLDRWLLAYWFFYHAGVSSLLAEKEGQDFFNTALLLSQSLCPRGTERRHFRGAASKKAVEWFAINYNTPEEAIKHISKAGNRVQDILEFVKDWPLFGPWIGFKVADMLERVKGVPIKFSGDDLKLYDSSQQGAKLLARAKHWDFDKIGLNGVLKLMEDMFPDYTAPPRHERLLNAQEYETCLCKWKSHLSGHYPVGKDLKEIREGLYGWGKLADRLAEHLPESKLK